MNNDPNEPKLLEHDADGIRELDNLLPRWWVWLFYITIAFSAVYMGYYHVFKAGDLQAVEYDKERAVGEKIKNEAIAKFEATIGMLQPVNEPVMLAQGKQTYTTYCLPCHREDGGGLVGPNLCDDFWIHGSNYVDNVKTIINGVPEKGMLTWRGVLKPNEIQAVASYIYTFRGTKPPNPKPPENQQQAPAGPSPFE
ncbi:MAG: cbb3-type cytochrome c oxidase N-terminal domain-containing protein [Verrucomicrobiota bacterium]